MQDVLKAALLHHPIVPATGFGHVQLNFITWALLFALFHLMSRKTSAVGAKWALLPGP